MAREQLLLVFINASIYDCSLVRAGRMRACRRANANSAADHGAAVRTAANPAADTFERPAHRLGGEEPLPPVPPRGGFPQARCRAEHQERARRRTDHGGRDRRARLGARHAGQPLHRPDGRRGDDLRTRWRARELSRAGRSSRRDEDRRCGTAGNLRLGLRRRRGRAAHLHGPLRRGSPHPPSLRQDNQRHGRCQQSRRAAAARYRASGGARSADRGPRRLDCGGRRKSGPAGHARRTRASASAASVPAASTTGRAARPTTATAHAKPRPRRRASSPNGRGLVPAG